MFSRGNRDPTVTDDEIRRKLNEIGSIDRRILQQVGERRANASFGKLIVRNLFHTIDNNELHALFSPFGQISLCKVVRDEVMRSKGFGFVYFEADQAGDDAIRRLNGKLIHGMKISVDKFKHLEDLDDTSKGRNKTTSKSVHFDSDEDEEDEDDEDFTNVYIKNFGKELDSDSLKELFSQFGEITNHAVKTNENGESAGYGYVSFKSSQSAKMAVELMNKKKIKSHELFVGPFRSKAQRGREQKKTEGCNLYVKNLSEIIDDKRLYREFAKFGEITSAKVMRKPNGNSKCHGFVCFVSLESAEAAKNEMNGKNMNGKSLYVASAQKKEDRKELLSLKKSVEQQIKDFSFKTPYYNGSFVKPRK
uniref:RRM domain-containing protein n=1 Tax=Strigamia maritima TaxID=126957 RepID=T1J3S9_STRMM